MSAEGQALWYKKNAERMRAKSATWYAAHKERASASHKKYYDADPERSREANRRWMAAHPVQCMLHRARHRAKTTGLEFDLVAEDVPIPAVCPVLGIPLSLGGGLSRRDHAPSIDRMDNLKGYVKGNVIVVSWRANRLKGDASNRELALLASFYPVVTS